MLFKLPSLPFSSGSLIGSSKAHLGTTGLRYLPGNPTLKRSSVSSRIRRKEKCLKKLDMVRAPESINVASMQAHSLKSFDDEIASGVVALSSHVHYPAATLW